MGVELVGVATARPQREDLGQKELPALYSTHGCLAGPFQGKDLASKAPLPMKGFLWIVRWRVAWYRGTPVDRAIEGG